MPSGQESFTGERLTADLMYPSIGDLFRLHRELGLSPRHIFYIRENHFKRYDFANHILDSLSPSTNGQIRVLDIASGIGYGVDKMKHSGRHLVGADINETSVHEANQMYGQTSRGCAAFTVADGLSLPYSTGLFDCVTCFETIEHVPDPTGFLQELKRVIKPEGRIVISTPNREIGNPGSTMNDKPNNHFHEFELSEDEFAALLRGQFSQVHLYGQEQYPKVSSLPERVLYKFGAPGEGVIKIRDMLLLPQRATVQELKANHTPTYFVAVCQN